MNGTLESETAPAGNRGLAHNLSKQEGVTDMVAQHEYIHRIAARLEDARQAADEACEDSHHAAANYFTGYATAVRTILHELQKLPTGDA